jgi:hypothetical protein
MGRWGRTLAIGATAMTLLVGLPACKGDGELQRTVGVAIAGGDKAAATGVGEKECARQGDDVARVRVQYFGSDPQPGSTGSFVVVRCPRDRD